MGGTGDCAQTPSHSRSATNTVHVLISSLDFGTSLPADLPPSGSPSLFPT